MTDNNKRLLRYLPASLRSRIECRPNLLKILGNTGWLFFDRILRLGLGLLIGVWVARYLGPEQFGLINYALAIVSLFTAVGTLGLNNIVVRDLVEDETTANLTLGTGCVLQLLGGVIAFALALVAISVMRPSDDVARVVVAVFGLVMVMKCTDVVRYWFEAKVQSKYIVWVENIAFVLFGAVKVFLILTKAPMMAFVWIGVGESALVSTLILGVYAYQGKKLSEWRWKIDRARELLKDSWPLVLSGIATMVYMRIDQIMLGQLLGDKAVGVYSAAVRVSEVLYFIPMTIAASVFPAIIEARKHSLGKYEDHFTKLFELMFMISVGLALPMTLLAEWIMGFLFGGGYSESASVLVIHVWTGVFVFSGVASSRWFVMEGLQRYSFYRTLFGGVINVLLNWLLIPRYGPVGAAWASVISQACASVFFNAVNEKTRPLFVMQMNACLRLRSLNRLFSRG